MRTSLKATVVAVLVPVLVTGTTAVAQPGTRAAVTYYVATTGSDTDSGTSAGSPFRNIRKCAEVMYPGDSCHIRGGVYRETVRPARSGTAGAPITYRPYQSEQVTLNGANVAQPAGWQRVTAADLDTLVRADPTLADSEFATGVGRGEIHSLALAPPGPDGLQVFFDGSMLVEGQWPHPGTDLLNPSLQFAGDHTTGSTIADPGLIRPAGYWNGARVYASTWFRPLTGQVTGYVPGSFTLADPACAGFEPGNTRYYLYGKFQAMTKRGTWFYAQDSQRLYVWAPAGDSPAAHTVEVKRRDLGFDLDGISHTTVDGLRLFGTSIRTGDTSTGVVLDHLDGRYLSHYNRIARPCGGHTTGETTTGIILRGTGNVLQRSTLAYSAGNGVAVLGRNNVVWFNTIENVDYMGTYAAGVNVVGNDHDVVRNTILRAGRSGVNIDWSIVDDAMSGVQIANNDISAYSRLSVDAAAIYICCEIDMTGSVIHHNRLHHAETMPAAKQWSTSGIYLDNSVFDTWVHNNAGCEIPDGTVFLNGNRKGSTGNRVENNTGGVRLLNIAEATGTRLVNNLGPIRIDNAPDVTQITNFTGDVRFVDLAACDLRLRADSPARNAGTHIPGVTVGYTDPLPSIGAYQYGAIPWEAGA